MYIIIMGIYLYYMPNTSPGLVISELNDFLGYLRDSSILDMDKTRQNSGTAGTVPSNLRLIHGRSFPKIRKIQRL